MDDSNTQTNVGPIIVDLGKKKRKQVKQLHKGEGVLIESVNNCIEELKKNKTIAENSQPVIIVVEKKPKKNRWGITY